MGELLEIKNGNFKFVFGDIKIRKDLLRFFIGPSIWLNFMNIVFP